MKKLKLVLIVISVFSFSMEAFGTFSIQRFDYSWCTSTYPSSYAMGTFSISETSISGTTGFTKGQNSCYIQFDLSTGMQFNTTGSIATITASSPEVKIDSFKFISATRLWVWITTAAVNNNYDVIYFKNFEIRATSAGLSRTLAHTGGTFKIDNSTGYPLPSQYLGIYNARTPFVYASSAVDQPNLANIGQYTINNAILRIRISGTGNCSGTVTQFSFNTNGNNGTGTDSVRNISKAKVYFTGGSSTFATTTYFGEVDLPNGIFTINGSLSLINGNNYFWLTYDVPGDANTNPTCNNLDASMVSFTLEGSLITNMATPSPTGHRHVVPSAFYYSKASGNWTDNIWAVSDNGPLCNCQPNGAGIVVIDTGHTVNMNKSRTVDVTKIMKDGSLNAANAAIKFITNTDLTTSGSGRFYFLGDITVKGNVTLNGTGISEFHKVDTIGGDLYVAPGATYKNMASSTYDVMVGGNLTIDGYLQNTQANVVMYGGNTNIDGTGTIKTTNFIAKNGNKTVKVSADLYVDAGFQVQGAYYVDNFGKINIRGNMDGNDGQSLWINESGSDLSYGGSAMPFATNGILDARDDFNIVRYSGTSDQTICVPKESIYYDLALEAGGTKNMIGDISLHGDFYFNAGFGHATKRVTVNGSKMQYFTGIVKPTLYNLTMDNSSNGLTLQLPVDYSGALTLSSGKIFTDMTNILKANDNATAASGCLISFVHGPMQKVGNDAFVFPVGKNSRWARLGITVPLATSSSFTVEYFDEKYSNTDSVTPPIDHVSSQEYWNLLNTAKLNDPVNVKLYWEDAGWSGITDYNSDLVVAGWTGTSWIDRGQSAITASDPGNVTSGITTAFGPVTLGSKKKTNPLPISLLSFEAKCSNSKVIANWSTAVETNNEFFTLENSIDAKNWYVVDKIAGAENSNQILYYQFTDEKPLGGISYYRLKQTDFDGNSKIFSPVSVICSSEISKDIVMYPNPFKSELFMKYTNLDNGIAIFKVFDITGHLIINRNIEISESSGEFNLDLQSLPTGVYFVEYSSGDFIYHQKVLKE
jgi:hypothetical protein